MKSNKRIYLVGMPGSGKSFFGKNLANELDVPFIDMDDETETREKKTISEIFEIQGEEYFRKVEATVLRDLTLNNDNCVISTGGGAPCFHQGMDYMNANGVTIYLKTEKSLLIERLERKSHRPLMHGDIVKKTELLLETRGPIYEKAHLAIDHREVSSVVESLSKIKN
ncbi:MAG: shikimate kinase [Marinoscillum sp.]